MRFVVAAHTSSETNAALARAAAGFGLVFTTEEAHVPDLSRMLVTAGLGIAALVPETATLEHLFFELTEGAEHPHRLEAVA